LKPVYIDLLKSLFNI